MTYQTASDQRSSPRGMQLNSEPTSTKAGRSQGNRGSKRLKATARSRCRVMDRRHITGMGSKYILESGTHTESTHHEAAAPGTTRCLDLETQTPYYAHQVLLHERFTFFCLTWAIEFEEAFVTRRFYMETSTITTIVTDSSQVNNLRERANGG